MKTLNPVIAQLAEEIEGVTPYWNYSGRGMYGRTCVGFVLERGGLSFGSFFGVLLDHVCIEADDKSELVNLVEELAQLLRNACIDDMGLDTIVYFPLYCQPE